MSDNYDPELAAAVDAIGEEYTAALEAATADALVQLVRRALFDAEGDIDDARYRLGVRLGQLACGGQPSTGGARARLAEVTATLEADDAADLSPTVYLAGYLTKMALDAGAEADLSRNALDAFGWTLVDVLASILDHPECDHDISYVPDACGATLLALGRLDELHRQEAGRE